MTSSPHLLAASLTHLTAPHRLTASSRIRVVLPNSCTGGLRAKRRVIVKRSARAWKAIITSMSPFCWPLRLATRGRGLRLLPSPSWGFATAPGLRVPPLGGTPPPRHTYVCRDVKEPTSYLCLHPLYATLLAAEGPAPYAATHTQRHLSLLPGVKGPGACCGGFDFYGVMPTE